MAFKIISPSEAPKVKEGFIRHQFILVLGKNDLEKELNKNPLAVEDILLNFFGTAATVAEKVMTGDYHAWHVWHDFEEGEFENLQQKDA